MRKALFFLLLPTLLFAQQYDSGGNLNVDPRRWGNVTMSAAAAMADNASNPTAPPMACFNTVWDGATWDRWTGLVTGNNFDIRDLVAASDAVSVHGDVGIFDQFDLANSNPNTVAIVDANGDQITSFGGGTEYAQGTATTDTDVLKMAGAVRRDTAAVATGVADGDRLVLSTDSVGRLRVTAADTTQPVSGTVTVTDGAGALNVIVDSGTLTAVTAITNALPAGNNNIGDVDVATIAAGNNNIGDVDVASIAAGNNNIGDVDVASIAAGTNYIGKVRITDGTLDTTLVDETGSSAVDSLPISGGTPHDSVDSGNPVKIGFKTISYGSAPTATAAADRANAVSDRQGVQFVLPYHPNGTAVEYLWTSAQTNDALVTVSSGTRICVTGFQMTLDEATTVGVGARCGFGASSLSTAPTDGNTATGIFLTHLGVVPGSGINSPPGMFLCGADDEDVRCTTEATTSGTGKLVVFYFTTAN